MSTLLKEIQKRAAKTYTENGDTTFSTTLNANLDFFGATGALRNRPSKVPYLMDEALDEDKNLAIKNMFYLRDVRGGVGERNAFRLAYKTFAKKYPEDAVKLIPAVAEYGRWDDILCLFDLKNNALTADVIRAIGVQLAEDIENMKNQKSVSLLAKWMPSINTSSDKSRKLARLIAKNLGMSEKQYRQTLSALRGYIDILERHLSAKDYSFDYSKLPAQALMRHIKAFKRNDEPRYTEYKNALASGKIKAKTSAVYPYEIINIYDYDLRESVWRDIERHVGDTKTIVVRDGSGSMTSLYGNSNVRPIDVATSLAILFSEQLTGPFKDKFITFSSTPQFVDLSRKTTLEEKLNKCRHYTDVSNTNIMKVYKLILEASKNANSEDWLERIIIISDMQFDYAAEDVPSYDVAKAMFDEAGIPFPQIVFWNVNSKVDFPSSNLEHVRFVSGCSQYTIKAILEDKALDAIGFMKDTLEKYDPVLKLLEN